MTNPCRESRHGGERTERYLRLKRDEMLLLPIFIKGEPRYGRDSNMAGIVRSVQR